MRYVQAALGTPSERVRRPRSLRVVGDEGEGAGREPEEEGWLPLRLWDSEAGDWCAARRAAWSEHYRENSREPEHTLPAPWVLDHYRSRAPRRVTLTPQQEVELKRRFSSRTSNVNRA